MSNRFGNINNYTDLEKAIFQVKAEQKAAGAGIRKDFDYLVDSWKPSNLLKSIIPDNSLTDVGAGLVQGIKKIFTIPEKKSRKKGKTEAIADAETQLEAIESEIEAIAAEVGENSENA